MEFEFWHSKTEAIIWHFDRAPRYGEEIVLGRSIYRVLGQRPNVPGSRADASFDCERVREATREERRRGVNFLPRAA
jgi:hypothetical protein